MDDKKKRIEAAKNFLTNDHERSMYENKDNGSSKAVEHIESLMGEKKANDGEFHNEVSNEDLVKHIESLMGDKQDRKKEAFRQYTTGKAFKSNCK